MGVRRKEMRYIFNGIVILFSCYIIGLIIKGNQNTLICFSLFFIEWLVIMLCKPKLRKLTFMKLHRKESFGEERKTYGVIQNTQVEEVMQKIHLNSFKELVIDLFKAKGYQVEETKIGEEGVLIATKGEILLTLKLEHRLDNDWFVSENVLQQVDTSLSKGKKVIITNGRFTRHTIKQAKLHHIELINGNKLIGMIREEIDKQRGINSRKIIGINNKEITEEKSDLEFTDGETSISDDREVNKE